MPALLSLFNIAGRIGWASLSDYIGRKRTYFMFFVLGTLALRLGSHSPAGSGAVGCSSRMFCVILTMYGGGFATIPAYLADMFGTQYVGRHSRPAADRMVGRRNPRARAGELHPGIPDRPRECRNAQAYNVTMYVLAVLLVVGFFCNLAVRPVDERHHMTEDGSPRA